MKERDNAETVKAPVVWSERTNELGELGEIAELYNQTPWRSGMDPKYLKDFCGLREGQKGMILRRSKELIGFLTYEVDERKNDERVLLVDYVKIKKTERGLGILESIFELLRGIAQREDVKYIAWFPMTPEGRRVDEKVRALSDSFNNDTRIPIALFTKERLLAVMREQSKQ